MRNHLAKLNPILNKKKRIEVLIHDYYNNKNTLYGSIVEAAKAIKTGTKTIWDKSIINNKDITPFRGRYVITKLSEEEYEYERKRSDRGIRGYEKTKPNITFGRGTH